MHETSILWPFIVTNDSTRKKYIKGKKCVNFKKKKKGVVAQQGYILVLLE